MKLVDALVDGLILGLETTEEAVMNIVYHADSYFVYEEINDEIEEIIHDFKELPNPEIFIKNAPDGAVLLMPNIMINEYFPEAVKQADIEIQKMYG